MKNKLLNFFSTFLLFLFFCIFIFTFFYVPSKKEFEKKTYEEFRTQMNNSEIDTVYLTNSDGNIFYYTLKSDERKDLTSNDVKYTDNPQYDDFKKDLLKHNINIGDQEELSSVGVKTASKSSNNISSLLFNILFIAILILPPILFFFMPTRNSPVGSFDQVLGLTNNTKEYSKTEITDNDTFQNIIGLKEVKKDMISLVDFIKNNDKYVAAGAELPRGVILYGPPGTGKTMLARAVAKEADVPFYFQSGSDFVEKYVGVGAKRVRDLFATAKKNAPCIVFIDEIDAIGGKRDEMSGSSEDLKTINALLTEMDGFTKSDNILVIATTNRLESLDPALVRAGRFTNKYCVPLPETPEERKDIINFYIRDKKLGEDVDIDALAKNTIGCSPADIKTIINEAAIISVQNNSSFITNKMIDDAMMKNILQGHLKEDQINRDKKELEIVAVHEAGHALLGKLMGQDVSKVTILATTNGAGGVTFTIPEKMALYTVDELKQEVIGLYGGRAAEKLMFGENKVTTGASNDIEKASNIIKKIVSSYGFNDKYGMLNLDTLKVENKAFLEEEIKLAKELENEADRMLNANKGKLKKISELLLEKETIYSDDLNKIMKPAE